MSLFRRICHIPLLPPKKLYKAEETHARKLPPRNRRKRVMPDMISHDDIDLMSKRRKAAKNANTRLSVSSTSLAPDGDRSSSGSEFDESDDEEVPVTVRKPIPIVRVENQEWLMGDVESFCHRCRRRTFYAKMTCSECQKKILRTLLCIPVRLLFLFELSITSKLSFVLCISSGILSVNLLSMMRSTVVLHVKGSAIVPFVVVNGVNRMLESGPVINLLQVPSALVKRMLNASSLPPKQTYLH